MAAYIHQWFFFFAIVGSIMFFVLRFSRLARSHGKNRWLLGFVGAACFLASVRLVFFIAVTAGLEPGGYTPSYLLIVVAFLLTLSAYLGLKQMWSKQA